MIVEVIGEIILPKLVGVMINTGVAEKDAGQIINIGLIMAVSALIALVAGILGNYFAVKASVSFGTDLRYDVFSKIQSFSFKNVDDFSAGSLVTRTTNDITQMQHIIRMGLLMMFRSPGMLIGGIVMALSINKSLALVMVAVMPFLMISLGIILKLAFSNFDSMQKKIDNLNTVVRENITNMRVVKSFLREDFEKEKFVNSNFDLRRATQKAMNIVICTNPVMTIATNVATIAVVWIGGSFIMGGTMDVGDLTAFTSYVIQIFMSLMMLSMIIIQASRAVASSRRVKEVLNTEIDIQDREDANSALCVNEGKIEFKNVNFKYHEESYDYILKNINLTINPGETVGIIGSTGSGKTTLVHLIPRLYDVTSGEILVDGVNVKDYTLKNLRKSIAMVLQKNVLFSGTVEENIRWGKEDATEEEIKAAAKSAQADLFIENFNEGYETQIEQGGVNVSGGQKQRLCIARALIGKPRILILDDSTSAVDTATEAKIREHFKSEEIKSTKIIIAQRIQSVIDADKIVVLSDGRIDALGTHAELIASNEEYKEIYYSQVDKEVSA